MIRLPLLAVAIYAGMIAAKASEQAKYDVANFEQLPVAASRQVSDPTGPSGNPPNAAGVLSLETVPTW